MCLLSYHADEELYTFISAYMYMNIDSRDKVHPPFSVDCFIPVSCKIHVMYKCTCTCRYTVLVVVKNTGLHNRVTWTSLIRRKEKQVEFDKFMFAQV